jgi:hypothetical protein
MDLVPEAMGLILFIFGVLFLVFGLLMILTKEYQETLRVLASHSSRLGGRAITEEGIGPVLDGMSRLLDSVRLLVTTAVGVGVFSSLLGVGLCLLGYWMVRGA